MARKAIAVFLSLIITISAFAGVDFSALASEKKQREYTDAYEEYFVPIIISDDTATQGGERVDTIVENGSIYIDAASLDGADIAVSEGADYCFVYSDKTELLMTEEETISSDDSTPDILERDGAYYVSLEDAAELFDITEEERGDSVVLAKPFQTKKLFVESKGSVPDVNEINRYKEDGYTVLEFESQEETEIAYNKLLEMKSVKSVTGENVYSASAFENEDYDGISWGCDYINSKLITEYCDSKDNEQVVVAVIDTGISSSHPLFFGRISSKSRSFVTSSYEDKNGHGTHCAGIVVDNTPSNVSIMAVQGLSSSGSASDDRLAKCIDYAVENGADIISMSWGGYSYWTDAVIKNAIKNAYDNGVILVAAAGNENDSAKNYYPANSSYCITVGATNINGAPASFSNYGTSVDVSAPGVDIKSAYINNDYISYSGTSMATPFVAAECATIITSMGSQTNADMKQLVTSNVTPIDNTGNRKYYGKGIIDYTFIYDGVTTSPVEFSVEQGYVDDEFELVLSCADSDAKIYYTITTIDDVNPQKPTDKNAILYTSPISVSESTLIRAVAYCDGKYHSRITKKLYRFNNFDFSENYIYDNSGTLLGYKGEQTDLAVPEYINGVRIVSVAEKAFNNSSLKSLVLPNSVTNLGISAFQSMSNVEKIIAKGVTRVPDNCFYSCSNLTTLELGKVTLLGKNAFNSDIKLNFSNLDFSLLKCIGKNAFANTSIDEAYFPSLTGTLPEGIFSSCKELIGVSMPRVSAIGANAFSNCDKLISIDMPEVVEISGSAINFCKSLTNCYFPKLRVLGDAALRYCEELTVFEAEKLESIGKYAFQNTKASEYYFPECVEAGSCCFMNCKNLEKITLGVLEYIPSYMFDGCTKLSEIPESLKNSLYVDDCAFRNTAISELDMPYAETIVKGAFDGCNNIEKIELPNIKSFGYQKMENEKITVLNLPNVEECGGIGSKYLVEARLPSCKKILRSGFSDSTALVSVYAPECMEIEDYAFENCYSLESFNFEKVAKIGTRCFRCCNSLRYVFLNDCYMHINSDNFSACSGIEVFSAPTQTVFNLSLKSEKLKAFNVPLITELNSNIVTKDGEFYLPNIEKLHIYAKNSNVNFHMPSLKTVDFTYGNCISDIAVPRAVQSLDKGINSVKLTNKVNIYTSNTEISVNENITSYEIYGPVVLQNDLPESFNAAERNVLYASVYCANPAYQWYYSPDGEDYSAISSNQNIIPENNGFYYCIISDNETGEEITTSVCNVTGVGGLVDVTFDFDTSIYIDGRVISEISAGDTLRLPENSSFFIISDTVLDRVYDNSQEAEMINGGYYITADENKVITCDKLIHFTDENLTVSIDDIPYSAKRSSENVSFTVRYGDKTLTENVDYNIIFSFPSSIKYKGTYVVVGKGDYSGVVSGSFNVVARNIAELECKVDGVSYYTGSASVPTFKLFDCGMEVNSSQYTVEYMNFQSTGMGTIIVNGKENYCGTLTLEIPIYCDLTMAMINLDKSYYEYYKDDIDTSFTVTAYGKNISAENYTSSFVLDKEARKATITITGKGYYIGTAEREIELSKPRITDNSNFYVILDKASFRYTASEIVPDFRIFYKDIKNTYELDKKDFNIIYQNNINPGTAKIILTDNKNFSGSYICNFEITNEHIWTGARITRAATATTDGEYESTCSDCGQTERFVINKIGSAKLNVSSYIFDGKEKKPSVTVTDSKGKKISSAYYDVSYASGRKNMGKYLVKITFKGRYSGTQKLYFDIVPDISLSSTGYVYDGKVKKPTVTLKTATGKAIGTKYYTVSYSSGRKNVGKYTVTIKLKNGHSGTFTKQFTIKPKPTSITAISGVSKGFTLKWTKQTAQTTGYQIQIATDSKFTKDVKNYAVSSNVVSKRITMLKSSKKYYVRMRTYKTVKLDSKTTYIYSSWSKTKAVTTLK